MKRVLPALAALGVMLAGTTADAQRVSRITAGKLVRICESPQGGEVCDAYLAGIADALGGARHFENAAAGSTAGATCIPQSVSTPTLRSTVMDYLHAHGDMMGKPAGVPVVDALHAAYPCGKTP